MQQLPAQETAGSQSETSAEEVQNVSTTVDESQILLNDTSLSPATGVAGVWVFIRMLLVLGLVLIFIWFIFKFLRKKTGIAPSDSEFLRRVAALSLGPGKSVQVVTLVDNAYLLGVCENSVNLISKIEDKELINALNLYADKQSQSLKPKNFAEILDLFMPSSEKSKKSVFDDGATGQIMESFRNQAKRFEGEE